MNARAGFEYSGIEWHHLAEQKADLGGIYGPLLKHAILREYEDIESELRGRGAKWDG